MNTIRNIVRIMMVVCIAGLFGCGGGSSSTTPPPATSLVPAKATTTVSGKVSFPSISSLVAKRVFALGDQIKIQAYTIDGVPAGSPVTPDVNGNFTISGLESGVDYVLKATRGSEVLKKLIEKATVPPGASVTAQNISDVSTTAVVVASQKLAAAANIPTLNLGEPVALTETQKTDMSSNIFKVVSPKDLETAITTAKDTVQTAITNNTLSSLTDKNLADLVNTLNFIVAAINSNNDPTKVISGTVQSFSVPTGMTLKPLEISSGGGMAQATAVTNVTTSEMKTTVTTSVTAYTPPSRVQLDILSSAVAGSLYGLTFDITIPPDATVKLDADGKPVFSLASGVTLSCLATASITGNVIRVVIADVSSLPTGKLVSFVFNKTAGVVLDETNFPLSNTSTSDSTGNALLSSFALTRTVTSSGS